MSWKITITPTETGVRVRTQTQVGEREVVKLSEYIERALLRFGKRKK